MKDKYTLAVVKGDKEIFASEERGIAPLLRLLKEGGAEGASAYDKVVGKAAAFLYVKMKVAFISACCMSKPAKQLLDAHGIAVEYEILADNIINRRGDGLCPMEKAVLFESEPDRALDIIVKTYEELLKKEK